MKRKTEGCRRLTTPSPTPEAGRSAASCRLMTRARPYSACAALILSAALLLLACERPADLDSEKTSTLTPDERYIVELYMKINELERNLQDNPADSTKKWEELRGQYDEERVRRILSHLEEDPERWLPVYNRIDELLERERP